MGIPKTGIFGLADLTGIDLGPHVLASMLDLLPADDPFRDEVDTDGPLSKLTADMIAKGRTGRKGGGGFYRRVEVDGRNVKQALDLATGDYRDSIKARLASARAGRKGLKALVSHEDKGGQYAWAVASKVLSYAAHLMGQIADDIRSVDEAMKTGYAWKYGPFEQIDQLGVAWFRERLAESGLAVPAFLEAAGDGPLYREEASRKEQFLPEGGYGEIAVADDAWMLADRKRGAKPFERNGSASLWDVGDGVACLELHSKMNAIDADTVAMFQKAARIDRQGYKALIIGSDADNFSVGANVGVVLFAANAAMWPVIDQSVGALQSALIGLRQAKFPVVAAVAGMALGGGCEIALHCDAVQAHAESYMGLVEVGVGVIPAGGGTKELLYRASENKKRPGGPMPPISQAFETISLAKVGTSAQESRDLLFLRASDGITMNRRRLLADAKARALGLLEGYEPMKREPIRLPGKTAEVALQMAVEGFLTQGVAMPHDVVVARELAHVLAGGNTDMTEEISEKKLLDLERAAFVNLVKTTPTLDRIEHMLETNRPLRN